MISYAQKMYSSGKKEGRKEGKKEGRKEGKIEGKIEGELEILLRLGKKRFGAAPPSTILARLRSITDPEALGALSERMFEATDWKDLLA